MDNMDRKIDKTGEEALNNFGSKIIIKGYRNSKDIDIYFPEYNWTAKNTRYNAFKKGQLSCPYEKEHLELAIWVKESIR